MAVAHASGLRQQTGPPDFNRPVVLQMGSQQPRASSHQSQSNMEDFLRRFYGTPAQAPHGPKFRPDAKAWYEHSLAVTLSDSSSRVVPDSRAKAKAKAMARAASAQVQAEALAQEQRELVAQAASSAAVERGPSSSQGILPIGLLFPGQGSQYVKMLSSVKELPAVRDMLERGRSILGYDILELCLEGPEAKLEETRYCQPAMFIAGLAGLEKLRVERPEAATQFQATAGLSLGEYTALCAAGVFSFEDGLRLVQLRGQAMQDAASMCQQAMLSVAGLDRATLAELCAQAASGEGSDAVCQIANELFPKGFACAGTAQAMSLLKDLAEAKGALQAKFLKTSGGFHTALMRPAQDTLRSALQEVLPRMKSPTHTVFMNTTAEPCHPGTEPRLIVDLLERQLTSPVRWEHCVRAMLQEGIVEFYEVGPVRQLKGMMKRIDQKAWQGTTNVEV
mmetsp:Transcript_73013/g.158470  ORF Transcript_73013/g.158470 Transcript_73013/m.158470 type:complete len:450 (-) Transcript_73013:59-1408(-)|eukprot:CAMPEP_0170622492 /NCGR_PEP_ID=MMETSP0224-20130122/29162_1 /TAXON_ID=285029 /ORGANISM="Togula jolla, Strain CCCM 725" /LENGTH=449 /DNA_ID=CAMNT_0010948819 /DNA_START=68 /DNA_END=1417 /DNA_ORIENTATION=+